MDNGPYHSKAGILCVQTPSPLPVFLMTISHSLSSEAFNLSPLLSPLSWCLLRFLFQFFFQVAIRREIPHSHTVTLPNHGHLCSSIYSVFPPFSMIKLSLLPTQANCNTYTLDLTFFCSPKEGTLSLHHCSSSSSSWVNSRECASMLLTSSVFLASLALASIVSLHEHLISLLLFREKPFKGFSKDLFLLYLSHSGQNLEHSRYSNLG